MWFIISDAVEVRFNHNSCISSAFTVVMEAAIPPLLRIATDTLKSLLFDCIHAYTVMTKLRCVSMAFHEILYTIERGRIQRGVVPEPLASQRSGKTVRNSYCQ